MDRIKNLLGGNRDRASPPPASGASAGTTTTAGGSRSSVSGSGRDRFSSTEPFPDYQKPLPATPENAVVDASLPSRNNYYAAGRTQSRSLPLSQQNTRGYDDASSVANYAPSISLRRLPPTSNRTGTNSRFGFRRRPDEQLPPVTGATAVAHYPIESNGPTPSVGHQETIPETNQGIWSRAQNSIRSIIGGRRHAASAPDGKGPLDQPQDFQNPDLYHPHHNYDPRMVDVLDTIDPEVQTLTSLTNVQNSLFVPDLGRYINRRPMYSLTSLLKGTPEPRSMRKVPEEREPVPTSPRVEPSRPLERPAPVRRLDTVGTIDSQLSDSRYAVLPHEANLEGWDKEDLAELNDHVRHMLHSKRSKFKRSMKGFAQYVSRPLGFLVTLYATLITLFGLAWVLFLIGWINVGGKQLYVINIIDYILVALFAIVGDGLIPFRIIDTIRMVHIAHYHRVTFRLRQKRYLPDLQDHNDLPTEMPPVRQSKATSRSKRFIGKWGNTFNRIRRKNIEKDVEDPNQEYSVLNHRQQQRLIHHQKKFARSHTFYKPHETETHYAFPFRLLIAIVILLDFHSMFQVALGAVTFGIPYHRRPHVVTTVILCCSITCNATAGLLILIGDRKTRKKDVLERMNRQELTQEAIDKMEKKWEKEEKKAEEAKQSGSRSPK